MKDGYRFEGWYAWTDAGVVQEKELAEKVARLGELNVLLDMDKKDRVVMEEEPETEEIEPEREKTAWVR